MPLPPPTRPHSSRALSAGPSSGIFASPAKRGGRKAEKDWDDAWDSSSDHEDHIIGAGAFKAMSIKPMAGDSIQQASGHLEPKSTPSQSPTSTLNPQEASPSGTGAWELVEAADAQSVINQPTQKTGRQSVRFDVHDILRDPLRLLDHLTPAAGSSQPLSSGQYSTASLGQMLGAVSTQPLGSTSTLHVAAAGLTDGSLGIGRRRSMRTERRRETFARVLRGREGPGAGVDIAELRRQAWSGVPAEVRPIAWQLLLNYLPLPNAPRLATLQRKRREYAQLVDQHFGSSAGSVDPMIWHQISIDVPRTRPGVPLWSSDAAQRSLERILYIWAIRHPASGYVQGINDLATPFFQVFLSAYIDCDPEAFDVADLDAEVLCAIEADSFWCLAKLLDGIQDNYITAQPGIQRLVKRMCELVRRIDPSLAAHLEEQGVEYMQFAFRWMNCLLMREISVKCTVRMWDTYLAEGTDAFSQFHLYVCSALLVKWSETLKAKDFQGIIMFLQNLPTQDWTDHDIALLLSEAFVLKATWHGAENHFAQRVGELPGMQGGMGGR